MPTTNITEDYSDDNSNESQEKHLVKLLVLAYPRYLFLLIEHFKKLFFQHANYLSKLKLNLALFTLTFDFQS